MSGNPSICSSAASKNAITTTAWLWLDELCATNRLNSRYGLYEPSAVELGTARQLNSLYPRDPVIIHNLASMEMDSGELESARTLLQGAEDLYPDNWWIHFDNAVAWSLTPGQELRTRSEFEKAIWLRPRIAEKLTSHELDVLGIDRHAILLAARDFSESSKEETADTLARRGEISFLLGNHGHAEYLLRKALLFNPTFSTAWYFRARNAALAGDMKNAKLYIHRAMLLGFRTSQTMDPAVSQHTLDVYGLSGTGVSTFVKICFPHANSTEQFCLEEKSKDASSPKRSK